MNSFLVMIACSQSPSKPAFSQQAKKHQQILAINNVNILFNDFGELDCVQDYCGHQGNQIETVNGEFQMGLKL
jgi:hypothetical protein